MFEVITFFLIFHRRLESTILFSIDICRTEFGTSPYQRPETTILINYAIFSSATATSVQHTTQSEEGGTSASQRVDTGITAGSSYREYPLEEDSSEPTSSPPRPKESEQKEEGCPLVDTCNKVLDDSGSSSEGRSPGDGQSSKAQYCGSRLSSRGFTNKFVAC